MMSATATEDDATITSMETSDAPSAVIDSTAADNNVDSTAANITTADNTSADNTTADNTTTNNTTTNSTTADNTTADNTTTNSTTADNTTADITTQKAANITAAGSSRSSTSSYTFYESNPSQMWSRHCEADTKVAVSGEVVGTIPPWLNGRLIRNGPGIKYIGESRYNHVFDALSQLHMINIEDGKASYTSRFLESDAYTMNHRSNRIVMGEFGTAAVPDPCVSLFNKFKTWFTPSTSYLTNDNCLVNVLQVKDELLAMTETNIVRIVDPVTLGTKPEKLQYSKYVSVQRATAHPHVEEDGTVYNLGFMQSKGPLNYVIISLRDGKLQDAKVEASVPSRWKFSPGYMHSFGLTENYYVLVEIPLAFDLKALMIPPIFGNTIAKSIKYYPNETTKFRLISRKTGEELKTNYISQGFCNFHIANCFETDGHIVIDICETPENIIDCMFVDSIDKKPLKMHPVRYVLPVENVDNAIKGEELLKNIDVAKISREDFLASASAEKKANGDVFLKGVALSESTMELPRINYKYNKKNYKYAYGVSVEDYNKDINNFDSIIKIDVSTGEQKLWRDKDYFGSEPVFVATPDALDEDDGVILTIILHKANPKKLALLILDASNMIEIARVNFLACGTVTPTFHGQFLAADQSLHSY